jgi:hypothetical protein
VLASLRRGQVVLAGVVGGLALLSVWHVARPTWHQLDTGYDHYSTLSSLQRTEAPVISTGLGPDLFLFVASNLMPGDRIYFQVPRTTYGTLNLHDTVAAVGRFYFLPAVEVSNPDRATVVFSYDADPRRLHRTFLGQLRWGTDYLSRLSYP